MKISLIAAIGKNRELGRDNKLLFDIPEDMKLFREKTKGHAVIMGRKTYESIGHPLPHRINIIISRDMNYEVPEGVMKATTIEEAIELGKMIGNVDSGQARMTERGEVFVIGGAQIYALAMPYADKLYLTVVNKEVKDADAYFPDYSEFTKVLYERQSRDKNYSYTFVDLERE